MTRQLFEYHPVVAYRFIPKLKARVLHEGGGYLVCANSHGFRSNYDFTPKKRQDVKRVLLFGDSYTAGDGVSNGRRYSDLLEKKIPHLEIYNFALPGTGTDQQYLAYREYATHIEHDILVISVLVENIRRITAHYRYFYDEDKNQICYAKPYYELNSKKLVLKNVPPAKRPIDESKLAANEKSKIDRGGHFAALRKLIKKSNLKDFAQKITGYQPLPEYDNPNSKAWQLMQAILNKWIKEHHKPVVLMPIPIYHYTEELSNPCCYQQRFRELAQTTQCHFHDPLVDLLKYPKEKRRTFRFAKDPHPTVEGHKALAASLESLLTKLLI